MNAYFGLGVEASWSKLQKAVFKGTDCGAFIHHLDPKDEVGGPFGIAVGSIVEGSDVGTETHYLYYPFTRSDLSRALDAVEVEAEALWQEANRPYVDDTDERELKFKEPFMAVVERMSFEEGTYLLKFGVVGLGSFELQGDLDTLDAVLRQACAALDEVREDADAEAAEHDQPDDHPGFDPSFLTF